jgi:hypothetical protein
LGLLKVPKNSVLWRDSQTWASSSGTPLPVRFSPLRQRQSPSQGSATCEPAKEGFTQGVNERGGFFMRADQSADRRVNITWLKGEVNSLTPARAAALLVFRDLIDRDRRSSRRFLKRVGKRRFADDKRLFARRMRPLSRRDLPLRRSLGR